MRKNMELGSRTNFLQVRVRVRECNRFLFFYFWFKKNKYCIIRIEWSILHLLLSRIGLYWNVGSYPWYYGDWKADLHGTYKKWSWLDSTMSIIDRHVWTIIRFPIVWLFLSLLSDSFMEIIYGIVYCRKCPCNFGFVELGFVWKFHHYSPGPTGAIGGDWNQCHSLPR